MFDVLSSLLAFCVIGLSAFGLGRPLLRKLQVAQGDPLEVAVWSLTLGLLLGGSLLLLLALAGWLYPSVIVAISLAGSLWALVELACVHLGRMHGRILAIAAQPDPAEPESAHPPATNLALVCGCLVLVASLVGALAPPTSPEALSRGLDLPKNVLLTHSVVSASDTGEPAPNIVQMWFLWALALDGAVTANLVHWLLGMLVALATVLLARPVVGRSPALLAGCLVLLCPGVNHQMSAPLEDLALGLFTTLALVAAWQVTAQLEPAHWAVAAGLMLGGAMAANPAGACFGLAIAAAWLYAGWTQRDSLRDLASSAKRLIPAAVVTALPWYLAAPAGIETGPSQPLDSVLVNLGPQALMALGGLLIARRLRGLNLILGVLGGYAALALAIRLPGRWWSPLVPLTAIAAVWVWRELDRLTPLARFAAVCAWGVLLLAGPLACYQRAVMSLGVATGWQSRHRFLLAHEPTYRAAAVMNRIGRPGDRLFCQDPRTFYFACPAVSERTYLNRQPSGDTDPVQCGLLERARAEGCSYALLAEPVERDGFGAESTRQQVPADPLRSRALDDSWRIGQVMPILEYRFADDNNRFIRYRLLRIR
ncbi:MAG: glycosyltransferase family 39 protein [Planctomycetia bacterium]|nr:glycosyltransferase family 39 protein [Planctomycetia bacterium]